VGPDEYIAGVKAARSLARSLGSTGKIAVVNYDPKSALAAKCEAGFADTIKREFPQIQVLNASGGKSTASALAATRDLLMRNPTVTGVFASTEATSIGAFKAMQGQGLEGKVKMVGFGTDPALIDALKSGTIVSLVSRDPYKMGYEAAKSVIAQLQGAQIELAPYSDTGLKVVTTQNINDPSIQTLILSE
jgi:ribose transport system substrate-binding protein